jgi:hypothetical protein
MKNSYIINFFVFACIALVSEMVFFLKIDCANAEMYYVDATLGNDNSDGLTPDRAWKTLQKVNNTTLQPGDSILFKRGEVWKNNTGQFGPTGHMAAVFPSNGAEGKYIYYGAYGEGAKPEITLVREKNNPSDWKFEGNNIWSTGYISSFGKNLLPNPSFEINTENWLLYFSPTSDAGGSMVRTNFIGQYESGAAGLKLIIDHNGNKRSDIQLFTHSISIKSGKYYKLNFRAKATEDFVIPTILLHKATSPYTNYGIYTSMSTDITTDWASYSIYYNANTTATDARITFYLGGVIPEGAIFYLDSLSLEEVDDKAILFTDVGNIIMDNKTKFGTKKWGPRASAKYWNRSQKFYWTTLSEQGDFYYDIRNKLLKLYSTENPAIYYNGDIKLVLRGFGFDISNKSYIIIDGIHLSMAGTYGAGMVYGNPHNIIIRNCDISFIGGADQKMNGVDSIRNGNGIGIENSGHDITIEKNNIWEIYDAAISPQSYRKSEVYNIVVCNNIIWNSEYGIEYWQRPEETKAHNIYFDNNTIVDSGYGWSHSQRPNNKAGHCLMVFENTAFQSNITFRNNICMNSTDGLIGVSRIDGLAVINSNNNYYNDNEKQQLSKIQYYPTYKTSKEFFLNDFADWIKVSKIDKKSMVGKEDIFKNKIEHKFSPTEISPTIDAGTDTITSTDFFGNPIYGKPDIGAIEYQPPFKTGIDKISVSSVRVYGDGKFRNLSSNSISPIELFIMPQLADRKQYLDITILSWGVSLQWQEYSENFNGSTNHIIGSLEPNTDYLVLVDDVLDKNIVECNSGVCTSDISGKISFIYTGKYSNRKFTITRQMHLKYSYEKPSPKATILLRK